MTVKLLKQQHSCTKADQSATTTHRRPRRDLRTLAYTTASGRGRPSYNVTDLWERRPRRDCA